MNGKELAVAIKGGKRVYGTMVFSPSPLLASYISNLGVDFVFIDTEHVPMDRHQLSWMCQAYKALGIAPVVRIPSPDPYQACMAIDAGACGLMAPYLETVEQVKALRGAVKLKPLKGKKLQDVLEGKVQLTKTEEEYLCKSNDQNLLFLNIESRTGMDNLDEMLKVPGVDGVIIGPHDLSISLGIPEQYDHPLFDEAVLNIIKIARANNVGAGNHYSYGIEKEINWAKAGMNIILNSSDIVGFMKHIGSELKAIKSALGDSESGKNEDVNI